MIAEIVLIPDGIGLDAAKASAQYVARGLSSAGMKVREHISVCPDTSSFQHAVSSALSRSNVLVTVGGMGKDSAFLAKTVLSRGLGLPLEENIDAMNGIRDYCRRTGERLSSHDPMLAMLPRGSIAFPGTFGKIPGCAISSAKQHIIMLPETQAEIAPMFNKYVTAYLGGTSSVTVTRTLRTFGLREQNVADSLGTLMDLANPVVSIQRSDNEVLVRVLAHAPTSPQAAALCTPVLQDIVDRLGDAAYGLDVDSIQTAVVSKLCKKELEIAIAEAGTGGMLARIINETGGCQEVLRYAVSVDTIALKEERLGVKRKQIKKRGNVSEYAAVACASAARERAGTHLGVAVLANTGDEKIRGCPTGFVYIAVATADDVYIKKLVVGDGDANSDVIVDAAVSRALNMARLVIDYYPGAYKSAIPLEGALQNPGITDFEAFDEVPAGDDKPDVSDEAEKSSFLDKFLIRKTDKRGVKVRKFIFFVAMLIFIGSAGYVGLHYYQAYEAKKHAEELTNMFEFGEMENVEVSPDFPKAYSLKFAGLWNVNPDVVAFISIDDTGVKYPIVQAPDNKYYLRRNFKGGPSQYGVPFMDYRVDVKKPSDNMVVYGHNMMDGQIFGEIIPYNPLQYGSIDYYREHPVIDCTTVYNENKYKIFSVFITNAYEAQGPVFAYHDFIDAKSGGDFESFISEVTKRSLINTTVDVKEGDKLLTLSTCTYEFKDARLVVVARALRRGESADVDVEGAQKNPAPLMPDIWYKTFGGNKPVGESTAEVVTVPTANSLPQSVEQSVSALSSSSVSQSNSSVGASQSSRSSSLEEKSRLEEQSRKEASERAASTAAEALRIAEESDRASKLAEESRQRSESMEEERRQSELDDLEDLDELEALEEDGELDTDIQAMLQIGEPGEILFARSEIDSDPGEDAGFDDSYDDSYDESGDEGASLVVNSGGRVYRGLSDLEIVSRVVQNEIGASFETEAIKAQAVAAYTYILHANRSGTIPYVIMASKPDPKVTKAVKQVLGEAVYYKNKLAFTPYHATSAGKTTSSAEVWGGAYPYLVSVDSSVDKKVKNFKMKVVMEREMVEQLIEGKLGIEVSGDPGEWFEILSQASGGYNGEMAVCGETRSALTGSTITGRLLRENVLGLRSARFSVQYSSSRDSFTFITYGYGHGVGMSQTGANQYALKGWSYKKILQHYYKGAKVK